MTLASGEGLARLIAFAATVYLARRLGADVYGVIGFAAAVLIYLSRFTDGGIDLGLGVREMAADPVTTAARAPAILTARVTAAVVLGALLSVVAMATLPYPDGVVLAAFGLTLIPVGASPRWILLGMSKTRAVAVARTIGEALMLILVLSLVHGRQDVLVAPLAQFIGDATAAALLLWWIARQGIRLRPTFDWIAIRPLAGRAWPLVASALLGLVIYNADFIFLRFFRDRQAVGLYAAAYVLVTFLSNMGVMYSLSLLPSLTRTSAVRADQDALYHTATAHVFAVGFPIALGGSLLAAGMIDAVFGSGYANSAEALRILIWAMPLSVLRDVPVFTLMALGREDQIMRLTAWAAALSLVLNVILIPPYGLIGAAVATVVTEGVRMVVALIAVRSHGFGLTTPARLWKALVAGAVMAAILTIVSPATVWIAIALGALGYAISLGLLGGIAVRRGMLPSLNV